MLLIDRLYRLLVTLLMSQQAHVDQQELERKLKRLQLITLGVLVGGTALLSLIDALLPKHSAQDTENAVLIALNNIGFVCMISLWVGGVLVLLVADSMRKRIKKAAKATK